MENLRIIIIIISKKCVFENGVSPAILIVENGKFVKIIRDFDENELQSIRQSYPNAIFEDFGNSVLMAGVVDSHVHVNDPGRSDWEGFATATRAAAAGGITTIVDMPLNSIPPTTSVQNLEEKVRVARKNAFVDIAFWGGVIPGNKKELKPLVNAGVVGFKCFLLPSGIDEFPHVTFDDVDEALEELKSTDSVLAFHAECEIDDDILKTNGTGNPADYKNFLKSRPSAMEMHAIEKVASACQKSGVRCHIVHLSAAEALEIVEKAKKNGACLTAETCHHYLFLEAEKVPNGATEYKCCPPIRERENKEKLWQALKTGILDMVVSDHSPCTEDLKNGGDFISAWGGISSLQFGLSLTWTGGRQRGFTLPQISQFLSANPAKLCGLEGRKGKICVGADADLVVWEPDEIITIHRAQIYHKNKLTPYEGQELFGRVRATFLRGRCVYTDGKLCDELTGKLLLRNQ
ncbi:allantoinase [Venturia canescens]|uniref:allantoinase n=1 Tax=Venturia canescens TaxID=32260 RepID=UPI001C9C0B32|nr:allantoinase [Venturia canescens]